MEKYFTITEIVKTLEIIEHVECRTVTLNFTGLTEIFDGAHGCQISTETFIRPLFLVYLNNEVREEFFYPNQSADGFILLTFLPYQFNKRCDFGRVLYI